jgi:uncharacterized protein (TIGR04255 family)
MASGREFRSVAAYIPFAGKNSIVEAAFSLQFAQPLAPSIAVKFDVLKSEFISDFPSFEKLQIFQLTIGNQQAGAMIPATSQTTAGFNASKIKGDGKPSRVFRTVDPNLSMHLLEYDHWAEAKATALRSFDRCLKIINLPSAQNPIIAVHLTFIDRFTFDGMVDSASAAELIKSDTPYAAPKIQNVGNTWHSNSSWSESLAGGQKALHQLNVQGAVEGSAFVVVNHSMQCRLPPPFVTALEGSDSSKKSALETLFDAQHDANAAVLKNLLNDKMLADIGMGDRKS